MKFNIIRNVINKGIKKQTSKWGKVVNPHDKNATFQVITCPNCDGRAIDYGDHVFCDECGYIQHKE